MMFCAVTSFACRIARRSSCRIGAPADEVCGFGACRAAHGVLGVAQLRPRVHIDKPGSVAEASEPGIFAEVVSISSTRSAGVSYSAYFIKSIELRPTFDLFLGARRELHFFGRVSSGEALIMPWFCRNHRLTTSATDTRRGAGASGACVGWTGGGVLSSPKLLGGDG